MRHSPFLRQKTMNDVNEAAVRLNTRPSVIQRLISEKILRAHDGQIRPQDLECVRKNNALLAKVSALRKIVAIEEAAAQAEEELQQQRRETVVTQLHTELAEAQAAANYQKMSEIQSQLLQIQGSN